MKTNVKIHLNDGEIEMKCDVMQMHNPFVNLKETLPNTLDAVLLEKKHSNLQTQIDLTDLAACWIVLFDENMELVSVKSHTYKSKAQYQVFISEPYMLLLPINNKLAFEQILSISVVGEEGGDCEFL